MRQGISNEFIRHFIRFISLSEIPQEIPNQLIQ